MQHLCWALAKDVRFSNQKLYNNIKNMLIRSLAYCQMLVDFVGTAMKSPIKMQQKQKGECLLLFFENILKLFLKVPIIVIYVKSKCLIYFLLKKLVENGKYFVLNVLKEIIWMNMWFYNNILLRNYN